MKIVNRNTFLSMPEGTVYSKYEPIFFGPLCIKGETIHREGAGDFWYQNIADAIDSDNQAEMELLMDSAERNGSSVPLYLHSEFRDGLYDEHQLFAVWEPNDVTALIVRLQEAMQGAAP